MTKGAIFDQDGLLFDTEKTFTEGWRRAGLEMGREVPDALPSATCGVGKGELPAVIRQFLPDVDADAYVERALAIAAELQRDTPPDVKPGVRAMLRFCRENGIRTAVASSSTRRLVEHNLAATGLADAFDAIVTGGDVRCGKPAPDIFLLAAGKIGVAPKECAVFEDAFSGIRAAHAAGCRPVLIPDRVAPTPEILAICESYPSMAEALETFRRESLVGREFVHFKGGRYRLEGFAQDSETQETMAVYAALGGKGGLWVRPAERFFETVERDGYVGPRFRAV